MRVSAIAVLVLALSVGAAVANPIVGEWFYVDFDPPNAVHRLDPAVYTTFQAYLMLDLTQSAMNGLTSISFKLEYTPGMSTPPAFTNLLPGDLSIGIVEDGITLASTDCMTDYPVPIGVLDMFYLGTPGEIMILDHPQFPRWLTDCNEPGEVYYYCVYSDGGVGMDPTVTGGADCGMNPVEEISWTSIKAMYR